MKRTILSTIDSIISTIFCALHFNLDYYEEYSYAHQVMIGINIGYLFSNGLLVLKYKKLGLLFHHVVSIYFIIQNYQLGLSRVLQRFVLIAESFSIIFNR